MDSQRPEIKCKRIPKRMMDIEIPTHLDLMYPTLGRRAF